MSIEIIEAFHLRGDGSFEPFTRGMYFRNFWGWVPDNERQAVLFTTEADQSSSWDDGLEQVNEALTLLGQGPWYREYTDEQKSGPYFDLRRSKFPEIVGYIHRLPFPAQPHLDMRPRIYHWHHLHDRDPERVLEASL